MRNFICFSGLTRVMHQRCSLTSSPHMFFNLRPVANFGLVLPDVIKFYAFLLQWGVFIAHHTLYALKIPLIYARMRGGEYTRKEGACIIRIKTNGLVLNYLCTLLSYRQCNQQRSKGCIKVHTCAGNVLLFTNALAAHHSSYTCSSSASLSQRLTVSHTSSPRHHFHARNQLKQSRTSCNTPNVTFLCL